MIAVALVFDDEFEFKTYFGFKCFQVEIPLAHFVDISQRLPHPVDRGIEGSLDHHRIGHSTFRYRHAPFVVRLSIRRVAEPTPSSIPDFRHALSGPDRESD